MSPDATDSLDTLMSPPSVSACSFAHATVRWIRSRDRTRVEKPQSVPNGAYLRPNI